jgi:hypothetical protein
MIDRTGRYTAAKMRQIACGSYVNYQDHTAALNQALIDAVEDFTAELLKEWVTGMTLADVWGVENKFIKQLKEQGE